ncbi:MAG TPA: hypothetical protein VGN55_20095 [Xanthobacteraceae bacterium]|jgi:hypothetical protein
MKLRWRDFLLFVALTAAAPVGPAFGQQGSGSIPDLSGAWGHNFLLFEPLSARPHPVATTLRTRAGALMFNAVGDYTNPILRPEAAAVVKRNAERELSGAAIPNPHNQCWPEPTPFTLNIQFGTRIIQRTDEVLLLYLSDHQVRRVRLNVPHSAHPAPSWQGESVGHYEGGTLVVDTIAQKVGPLSMIDRFGTPFSAAMHVVERYRLIDGALALDLLLKHEHNYFPGGSPFRNPYGMGDIDRDTRKPGLQVEITVDDPATFTTPWSGLVTYRPVLGDWPEAACAENTQGSGLSWAVLAPEAAKPDF